MTDQLQLTADVCQLHNMVHTALRDALTALLTLDTTLAQEVREKEKEIDRTSIRLDEACIAWLNEHPSSSEVSRAVASVKIVAPGSDSAVTATYTAKNTSVTITGFSLNSASKEAWLSLMNARLK